MKFPYNLMVLFTLVIPAAAQVDIEWARWFGYAGDDIAYGVAPKSGGFALVVGMTTSNVYSDADAWIVCVDIGAGDYVWRMARGGNQFDCFRSITDCWGGGYLIAGVTCSTGAGEGDGYLLRTSGNEPSSLYEKVYGGSGWDEFRFVGRCMFTEGYIATGFTSSFGNGGVDAWLVKLSNGGYMQWQKAFGGDGTDIGISAYSINNDGYMMFGSTNSQGSGDYDAWVVRTDASGNLLWEKTYGGTGTDYCTNAIRTSDGSYLICGYTNSTGSGNADLWLLKIDDQGNVLWENTYGGIKDDRAFSVCEFTPYGYLAVGRTASFGLRSYDVYLVRVDPDGLMYWDCTYGGESTDAAYALHKEDYVESFIVGATHSWGHGGSDMLVIKTGTLLGITEPESSQEPLEILSVSPVPFQNTVTVDLSLSHPSVLEARIYDMAGRLQYEVFPGFLNAGNHSLQWSGSDDSGVPLPDGQYFLVVNTRGCSDSARLLLIR